MSAEDLYRLRFVSDPRISPDGQWVTYVVSVVDDERTGYHGQIWLADAEGRELPRPLTSGQHRDRAPRWSPDGRQLAFLSNRGDGKSSQLYVLPLDGGEPRQITHLRHGAGAAVWSLDGTRLAFAAATDYAPVADQEGWPDEPGKPPRLRVVNHLLHKADGEGLREHLRQHLFVVPADGSGEARQVTDGDWNDTAPAWSPDGTHLAFVANREADRDRSTLTDVWVVPARGGRARRVTRHKGAASAPAWSPDGQSIAYVGHDEGARYGVTNRLMLVPASGGPSAAPSAGYEGEMGNVALSDARDPLSPQPPAWSADGQRLRVLASERGRVSLLEFGLPGGQPRVLAGGEREVGAFSVSASEPARYAFIASDPTHPYELFVCDADGANERQLTHENDALLRELELFPAEELWTTATDGEQVHGWLMRPHGATRQRRAPLVLVVHGGPETMYGWCFMQEFQLLAAHGFGVVFGNPRGSKGYSEAFDARIAADWGNQDAADCEALVDAALRHDWVDPERVGVTGGSYGGYMTAWLVGHTQRFRAAVATRGVYSFVSFYGTSDIGPTFGEYIFGGPVYEKEALYRERSPLTYATHIRTPLLLIQNEGDLRCPMEQAEQLFTVLKRLGQADVELVRFPEESHNLSRSGRPDRRVARLERIVGWFERYLRAERTGGGSISA